MTEFNSRYAMTPLQRRLLRRYGGIPGTGPRGESCAGCKFSTTLYDSRIKRHTRRCVRALDSGAIDLNTAACSGWEPNAARRVELDKEEIATARP